MTRVVSISTALFDGHPLTLACAEIAAAGARFVEPAYIRGYVAFDESAFTEAAARALTSTLADAGLSVHAVSGHIDMADPDAVAALRRRLRFAEAIGAAVLITNSGPAARRDAVLRAIEAVLPSCEQARVVLALENPGQGTGDLIPDGRAGATLVREIGAPWVRLNYDPANAYTHGGGRLDFDEDWRAALPTAAHVHLKDVAADGPDWAFTAIGDGDLDAAAMLRRLDRDAPALPVSLELPLRLRRPGRGDAVRRAEPLPLDVLRTALRRSLAAVGSTGTPGA